MSTSIEDTEFRRLWAQADLTTRQIAERCGLTCQGANKRARRLGLPRKGLHPTRLQRLQARLVRLGEGAPMPPWVADIEIRPVHDEYWRGLLEARTLPELARLLPLVLKVQAMVAARFPTADDLLRPLAESVKLVLWAQKVQSELPPSHDPVVLRQEAGRQLMQEIGSVLTPVEQDQMGCLMQAAAARLAERRLGRVSEAVTVPTDLASAPQFVQQQPALQAPW